MPRIAKPPASVADPGKVRLCGAAPAVEQDAEQDEAFCFQCGQTARECRCPTPGWASAASSAVPEGRDFGPGEPGTITLTYDELDDRDKTIAAAAYEAGKRAAASAPTDDTVAIEAACKAIWVCDPKVKAHQKATMRLAIAAYAKAGGRL